MANGKTLHLVGFSVGKEEFCVDILKVQEIIRMMEITKIPNAPEFVEGVINLRGKVIPIVDFGKRCNLSVAPEDEESQKRIVVAAVGEKTVGLVVGRVSQVIKLDEEQISSPPDVVRGGNSEFISGVGKSGDKLLILLDLDRLFNPRELEGIDLAA
ncbi:MAG TPA: chemotaxis protein CheW [Geobacteraceae bacterium]|nr:chemotaxis protein CheW [Geobacteraceae bacterium]